MADIHPTSDVDVSAVIGLGCKIWHYAQIREGVIIGQNATIGRGVYVGPEVRIGHSCKIQNYALIYDPAILGDGVFIGPGVVLTNDRHPRAIDSEGKLKNPHDWDSVGVSIESGASIGAGAICVAPVRIGEWSMIAAGAIVSKDVPDFALMVGAPARQIGWVGKAGVKLREVKDREFVCPVSGDRYVLTAGRLRFFGGDHEKD